MGPYDVDYLSLFLSVLSDWRIIAITLVVLLSWFLLRYVGLVFKTSRVNLPPPRKMFKQAKAQKPAAEEAIEIEE
jgi:hypothetical protein